jgi:hypothetical protein
MTEIIKPDFVTEIALADTRQDGDEHWGFNNADDTLQMQGVNCCLCGNYRCSSNNAPLPEKIVCKCYDDVDSSLYERTDVMELYDIMGELLRNAFQNEGI